MLALAGLLLVDIFGTALFYGDGVVAPAISVLSSVEGREVVAPTVPHPQILKALNPCYALKFMRDNKVTSFIVPGAAALCVTGAKARYADLGQFGKRPIRIACFTVVMLALTLNHSGQGALRLENPAAVKNPFCMMAPEWALIPLVLLATDATAIASQALITGASNVTRQVIQRGCLPPLPIDHTSVLRAVRICMPLLRCVFATNLLKLPAGG